MTLTDTQVAAAAERQNLVVRVVRRLLQVFAEWCASEDAPDDPTATFSSREWADLPTHHPDTAE
jgi:hypothetical protein